MKKKRKSLLILLILLLGISVGYALLSTTLKINGTSTITKNTWSIYWDNVGDIDKTDTTTVTTAAVVDPTDNTQVNFGVTLNLPGDYYEFQVDAVNNGTVDAMVDILTTLVNGNPVSSLPSYIKYEITYADGGEILPNHLLAKKSGDTATRERVKVRIEYLRSVTPDDVNNMPDDEPYVFDIDLTYKQADDNAEERSTAPTVETCPNCVYSYYTMADAKFYDEHNPQGQPRSTLADGVADYRTLKDENENRRLIFLGHELDQNGLITAGYVCAVMNADTANEQVVCSKGSLGTGFGGDASVIAANYTANQNAFSAVQSLTCTPQSSWTPCTGDGFSVSIYNNGDSGIVYNGKNCTVRFIGQMYCQ